MSTASAYAANAAANASTRSGSIVRPGGGSVAAEALEVLGASGQSGMEVERRPERPEPFQSRRPAPAISTTGRLYRSTSREATIPITPSCQSSPATTYPR